MQQIIAEYFRNKEDFRTYRSICSVEDKVLEIPFIIKDIDIETFINRDVLFFFDQIVYRHCWMECMLVPNELSDGCYFNEKKEGFWIIRYICGLKSKEMNYVNGKLEGLYMSWDIRGQKIYEMNYRNGIRCGLWHHSVFDK